MEIRLKHANSVMRVRIRNEMKVGEVLPTVEQNKLLGSFIDIVDATGCW